MATIIIEKKKIIGKTWGKGVASAVVEIQYQVKLRALKQQTHLCPLNKLSISSFLFDFCIASCYHFFGI